LRSDLRRALRRLDWRKRTARLVRRPRGALPFLDLAKPPPRDLLLDSMVYIDGLQDRLPADAEALLRAVTLWHSPVTAAELAIGAGQLDPAHAGTGEVIATIGASIARRPSHRILAPDAQIWLEAGLATGMLARLQGYARADRARMLNDALLFFTAAKHGLRLLTRNLADFDLLLQIAPGDRVLFYDKA
jgi:predicted nucleic acid-binding protein